MKIYLAPLILFKLYFTLALSGISHITFFYYFFCQYIFSLRYFYLLQWVKAVLKELKTSNTIDKIDESFFIYFKWSPTKCQCICKKKYNCDFRRVWNEKTCGCQCKKVACSKGQTQDPATCLCLKTSTKQ